jgi:hypothetical protein
MLLCTISCCQHLQVEWEERMRKELEAKRIAAEVMAISS